MDANSNDGAGGSFANLTGDRAAAIQRLKDSESVENAGGRIGETRAEGCPYDGLAESEGIANGNFDGLTGEAENPSRSAEDGGDSGEDRSWQLRTSTNVK